MCTFYVTLFVLAIFFGSIGAWVFEPAITSHYNSKFSKKGRTIKRPGARHSDDDPVERTFPHAADKNAEILRSGADPPRTDFPCIRTDPASVFLTIVIPAYNEVQRLPAMLEPALQFFSEKQHADPAFTFEIIIVDDGSTDGTSVIVHEYVNRYGSDIVRLLSLSMNQGKGSAVRKGMLRGRGQYLLMADADGATEITDYNNLMIAITEIEKASSYGREGTKVGLAIGSRAHLHAGKRSFFRRVLTRGMHFCVMVLCTSRVTDTQCGFKLFTREAAMLLFQNLHLGRWAFDVEVIHLAQRFEVPMVEVPVQWQEVDGSKLITSKLDVVTTSLSMLRDMLCIRLCYGLGIWKVENGGIRDIINCTRKED